MKTKQKNPPAFPSTIGDRPHQGMTLRDYFAAKAMQSVITRLGGSPLCDVNEQDTFDIVAKESYKYSDAMLKQREQ